ALAVINREDFPAELFHCLASPREGLRGLEVHFQCFDIWISTFRNASKCLAGVYQTIFTRATRLHRDGKFGRVAPVSADIVNQRFAKITWPHDKENCQQPSQANRKRDQTERTHRRGSNQKTSDINQKTNQPEANNKN